MSGIDPSTISLRAKLEFLGKFSEDDFRDRVVRPLFFRLGFSDGRDLCGPMEEGKDTLFTKLNPLTDFDIWVVQTKKGKLDLSSKSQSNLVTAETQLRTALNTRCPLTGSKVLRLPDKAVLCASGTINTNARKHIVAEINDPRITILDADELIPRIDRVFPELWFGIDAELLPYMRGLKAYIEESSEYGAIGDLKGRFPAAATDAMFVPLRVWRQYLRVEKRSGQIVQVPDVHEIRVDEILNLADRFVLIRGEAGAGKSTALRHIAYSLAVRAIRTPKNATVPVFLRAVDLARESPMKIIDCAAEETRRVSKKAKPSFSSAELEDGRVLLLVDALDEAGPDDRVRVMDALAVFGDRFPRCQVIVTSREMSFLRTSPVTERFKDFRITPFSMKQASGLIDKLHHGDANQSVAKELVRKLEQIHGMDLSPLLVAVFAATSDYASRDVPANISELFRKYADLMLGAWDASKGLAQQYEFPVKEFLLRTVAYHMHSRHTTSLSMAEFRELTRAELMTRGLGEIEEDLVKEILDRSGLMRVNEERVEFRHLLLQEYFAGRGIPNSADVSSLGRDEWWRRALVFHFGESPDDAGAFKALLEATSRATPQELMNLAVAMGLSLQACYLIPVDERVDLFKAVINGLAGAAHDLSRDNDYPVRGFLSYCFEGRDAVALNVLAKKIDVLKKWLGELAIDEDERDLREFWMILGLIEAGNLGEAERLMESFKPSDPRLLLGVHLGCYLAANVRVIDAADKDAALRISKSLVGRISGLRLQVIKEFRSELLEKRRGRIEAIESPSPAQKG